MEFGTSQHVKEYVSAVVEQCIGYNRWRKYMLVSRVCRSVYVFVQTFVLVAMLRS
jgi:hypothetical protein